MKKKSITPKLVKYIPEILEEGILYITLVYGTAAHTCPCGCGETVVTPIKPTNWTLIWNGEAISMKPSIGNWNFACQSHYWIIKNKIVWSRKFSPKEIESSRKKDLRLKNKYYSKNKIND